MNVRFATGLFRLWVVFSVLWLVGAGAYTFVAYRDAAPPDLTKGHKFDDLIPAYEHCWKNTYAGKIDASSYITDQLRAQIAECESAADRGQYRQVAGAIAEGLKRVSGAAILTRRPENQNQQTHSAKLFPY